MFKNDITGACGYGYNRYPTVVEMPYAKIPKPSRTVFTGESVSWYIGGIGLNPGGAGTVNFMNHDDGTASFYFVDGHSEKRYSRTVPVAIATNAMVPVTAVGYGRFTNSYFWGLRDCYYHNDATVGDVD